MGFGELEREIERIEAANVPLPIGDSDERGKGKGKGPGGIEGDSPLGPL
jgi:hypothetical protein